MREIELIIFDLDGTLVDSRQDIVNAANFMLENLMLNKKPFDEIVSYVGKGIKEFIKSALGKDKDGLSDKALEIFKSYYIQHPADYAYLYPGVIETLKHFDRKKKAVITNRNHKSSKTILEKMGIAHYFENIVGDNNTTCLKPSKCQFDRLFDKLSLRNREKAIMVGDMDIDILAGRAAGILTCAVMYGLGKRHDIEKAMPDYIIDEMAKLKDIIK
jgi:phosphoglycolate phosphatase